MFYTNRDNILEYDLEEKPERKWEDKIWYLTVLLAIISHVFMVFCLLLTCENDVSLKSMLSVFLGLKVVAFSIITFFLKLIFERISKKKLPVNE